LIFKWLSPVASPAQAIHGLAAFPRYFLDWRKYSRLGGDKLSVAHAYPQLHDNTSNTAIEAHYFNVNGWAMRRILAAGPVQHIDVGSQSMFVNLLSAVVPVVFVDYRPVVADMTGLWNCGADILKLPFADNSIQSLSCLHVAEHVGLGRYGDPLNPAGTRLACAELARVLAPDGNLFFAVPVGKPRVCFNAHRVHLPETIVEYFRDLRLIEMSGEHDDGRFVEHVRPAEFNSSEYACGMFWFRKASFIDRAANQARPTN
jgi:uncharacterized protein DUF268